MPLITRQGKGEKLTIQEMDGNLTYLEGLTQDIESSVLTLASDLQEAVPYRAYRAKIAMQTVAWPGYGYLYNWYAATDVRKLENPAGGTGLIAPNEWRVPSDTDWTTLAAFAGGSVAGTKLKSAINGNPPTYNGWLASGGGTDDYNFSGLPGGRRDASGQFEQIGVAGWFWASTPLDSSTSRIAVITTSSPDVGIYTANNGAGLSVRLVREATASELLLADGDTSDTSSLDPYTGNDGKVYVTVKIGTQVWLAQNLRETKYNDNSNIFNASNIGGNVAVWSTYGNAGIGAWTAYLYNDAFPVEYDPAIIKVFYDEVLENTLGTPDPLWVATEEAGLPVYIITCYRLWNKTHIKVTPGYDVSDFPTINERSLLIERAVDGETQIVVRPIKKDGTTGAITIEDLNNYSDLLGGVTSYVYVEILEYQPESYYYSGALAEGIGVSNL